MVLFGIILLSMLITSTSCSADETSNRSQGCGRAAPATPPVSIEVGGRTTPNTRVRKYYRIEQNSKVPTIFVYPAGLIAADGKYSWYERSDPRDRLRNFALFDALLEKFSSSYCTTSSGS